MRTKVILPRIFSFTGGARNDSLRSVLAQPKVVQTKPKGKLRKNRSIFHINLLSVLNLIGKLSRDTFYQTVLVQYWAHSQSSNRVSQRHYQRDLPYTIFRFRLLINKRQNSSLAIVVLVPLQSHIAYRNTQVKLRTKITVAYVS